MISHTLHSPDHHRSHIQVVADALAKSVVLEHYETTVAGVFDEIEPLAEHLRERTDLQAQEAFAAPARTVDAGLQSGTPRPDSAQPASECEIP